MLCDLHLTAEELNIPLNQHWFSLQFGVLCGCVGDMFLKIAQDYANDPKSLEICGESISVFIVYYKTCFYALTIIDMLGKFPLE